MTYESVHAAPEGPGDARPTAMQVIEDEKLINQLTGKVFIITGGSSGIGIETARAIYATGAHVFITARDVKKGQEVADDIKASLPNSKGKIEVIKLRRQLWCLLNRTRISCHSVSQSITFSSHLRLIRCPL